MIKAIIFDLDNMVYLSKGLFSSKISQDYSISQDSISEFFKNEYKLCRIGKLDTKKALIPYIEKWNFPGDVDDFLNLWFRYGEFDKEMLELVKRLKEKGIKCILATNNEKNRIQHYEKELSIFDEVAASYMYGCCKPEKEMMSLILKKSGCDPEEILFCDDKLEFEETAKKYGFQTHIYKDINNFKKDLSQRGLI